MKYLAILFLSSAALFAQDFKHYSLGFKGGVPLNDQFEANSNAISQYGTANRRWLVGATGEFHFNQRFSVEVDGIYKRIGYDSSFAGPFTLRQSTQANQWEIPVLFKYNFAVGHFKPFVDVGASLRHITSMKQTTYGSPGSIPIITDSAAELLNRNSYGGVAGFGLNFHYGHVQISPEARYTRWANSAFASQNGPLDPI